jgi:hypothetical protein
LFTVARIRSAAVAIVRARADEPFFRGVEPERSSSHTADANARPQTRAYWLAFFARSKRDVSM